MTTCVIICHHVTYNPLFYNRINRHNFAPTNFYHQFQAIGNNYNQTVKAVKSNFGEKRAFALLRNLEKAIIDLVVLSKRIIMLTREFEEEYLIKRNKEEQQNGG